MGKDRGVILCIDDDPDIRDFFQTVLEAEGHEVIVSATGEEGLRAFNKKRPDIIFVDLMMEEIDAGTSFVKEVKALGSGVPIYMVTSVGDTLNIEGSEAVILVTCNMPVPALSIVSSRSTVFPKSTTP